MFLKSYFQPKMAEKEIREEEVSKMPGYYHNPFSRGR
jgi:hypothetical protein